MEGMKINTNKIYNSFLWAWGLSSVILLGVTLSVYFSPSFAVPTGVLYFIIIYFVQKKGVIT